LPYASHFSGGTPGKKRRGPGKKLNKERIRRTLLKKVRKNRGWEQRNDEIARSGMPFKMKGEGGVSRAKRKK